MRLSHVVYFHRGAGVEFQSFGDANLAGQFYAERRALDEIALPPRQVAAAFAAPPPDVRRELCRRWERRQTWRRVRSMVARVLTFGLWR